jgi:hypothetical protein
MSRYSLQYCEKAEFGSAYETLHTAVAMGYLMVDCTNEKVVDDLLLLEARRDLEQRVLRHGHPPTHNRKT